MLVQDAAYMVVVPNVTPDVPPLENNPIFLYYQDNFQKPAPFRPDIVVALDDVWEKKVNALDAHTSQFYEWLPWVDHRLNEVPKGLAERKQWLSGMRVQRLSDAARATLVRRYGAEQAGMPSNTPSRSSCASTASSLRSTNSTRSFRNEIAAPPCCCCFWPPAPPHALDLTQATVVAPSTFSAREKKAVTMLVEEVEKRSWLRWPVAAQRPGTTGPAIVVSTNGRGAAEGYTIAIDNGSTVRVDGNDARGVLFGVGHLLRTLHLERGRATLPGRLHASPPRRRSRSAGHQLGYRPKTNSYDGWDLRQWEQYIRDLAVFGANAIELIPPRSDDDADSPHFPCPPIDMMIGMSRICRRVRPRRLDLVSGDGRGLLQAGDRRVRAEGVGRRARAGCRASTPCSCPAAIPATRSRST